jgi:hypothetical protein
MKEVSSMSVGNMTLTLHDTNFIIVPSKYIAAVNLFYAPAAHIM